MVVRAAVGSSANTRLPSPSTVTRVPQRGPSGKLALSHSRVPSLEPSSMTMISFSTLGSAPPTRDRMLASVGSSLKTGMMMESITERLDAAGSIVDGWLFSCAGVALPGRQHRDDHHDSNDRVQQPVTSLELAQAFES